MRESEADTDISCKSSGSRTASPLTTSGGIITKRGPQVDQTEVAFEFKLNVTETQFVVVENLASLDTNAVILKVGLCLLLFFGLPNIAAITLKGLSVQKFFPNIQMECRRILKIRYSFFVCLLCMHGASLPFRSHAK